MREAIKTFKLKRILKHENFFIISGKNSFFKSKFKNHFEFKNQNNIFLKKNNYPNVDELKKILLKINSYKPNFIIAGGGSVLDYAKLFHVFIKKKNKFFKNYKA